MRSVCVPRPIPAVVVFYLAAAALSVANAACAPPPGFSDTPHPVIAPSEQLVAHTEEILIDRPLSVVSDAMRPVIPSFEIHRSRVWLRSFRDNRQPRGLV